jgi:3',5'-cyclic AMP phosphodiesterase CpdA
MIRIAVIADPHVHDTTWLPDGKGLPGALRSYADTAASTRVFNESIPAFRAALDCAVAEGARIVVVPGDLTDDGQRPNIEAALRIIGEYEDRHGLRVFMTPGNHDFFARRGRRQVKEFVDGDGKRIMLDSGVPTGDLSRDSDLAMLGAPAALMLLSDLGFQPRASDLHFETPFGTDPDFASRLHRATSLDGLSAFDMIDASYLIEPVEGLWLLSIDANVVAPRDGSGDAHDPADLHDPTDGGWPAVLRVRPYLLDWMRDVASRAHDRGKTLVAFSHYPALDSLGGTSAAERDLFAASGLARRAPDAAVARAFAKTGVRLHLSGHLHVNDTGLYATDEGRFANLSVPSPVGFVPAMKILDLDRDRVRVRTLRLDRFARHDLAFPLYRREADAASEQLPEATAAASHLEFIDHHLRDLVAGRYMAREWPQDMLDFVGQARLSELQALLWPGEPMADNVPDLPLQILADDWYRLRKGADMALDLIPGERLALYRDWASREPAINASGTSGQLAGRFAAFLAMLRIHLDRVPTADVTIDLSRMILAR